MFDPEGTTTAGNAPGVNDGAACVLVASEEWARRRGIEPLATILAQGYVADEFAYLARTPAKAAAVALARAGKTIGDVERVEINEAFSSVAAHSTQLLGADEELVNVNGGAVALGHPIGASGARILGDARPRAAPRGRRARPGGDLLGRRAGRRPADRGVTAEVEVRAAGGVVAPRRRACCSSTGPPTTTGRCRRASSTRASRGRRRARREVEEETGLALRAGRGGRPLVLRRRPRPRRRRCATSGWSRDGEPVPQNEVDEVRWVPLEEAPALLSYERDRELVTQVHERSDGCIERLEHVLVVGAGQMGGGIAQVVAASGRRVSLHDPFPGATERALETMERSLGEARREGRAGPGRDARADRASSTSSSPADLMIEAVVEDAGVKEEIFRRADEALPAHAILASNTSSIPIGSLAAVTGRPDRVIGMHFFNPVPVLKLVEVIRAEATSDETAAAIVAARPRPRQGAGRGARRRRASPRTGS